MSEQVTFKITVPHDESTDYHGWWFPNGWRGIGPTEQRDRAGRQRGKRRGYMPEWFVLQCNNPKCSARAVVPVSFLTDFADKADKYTREHR